MTTNPPVTVTYTLEDLFTRFEQNINEKIDKQSTEVKEQFAEVNQKLVQLEVGQATLAGEIKALDATVAGISKRIDNAEFFDRGVAIALVAAVFGGLIKWFGWLPTN